MDGQKAWVFLDNSAADTVPIMFHVRSAHKPDNVRGGHCVECLEHWPCAWWLQLRKTALAILSIPPDDMMEIAATIIDSAAEEIHEIERLGSTPVSLAGARARHKHEH